MTTQHSRRDKPSALISSSVIAFLALVMLEGCSDPNKEKQPPVVRPALSIVVGAQQKSNAQYVGIVDAQKVVTLAFRTPGLIVAKRVRVGSLVKNGDLVATIDSSALNLAVQTARSNLAGAEARQTNSLRNEQRMAQLLKANVGSQADFDSAQQSRKADDASVTQAMAALTKAQEQLGYTQLHAEFDGVITTAPAEVGQNVAAGKAVATLANPDSLDAVFDLPSSIVDGLHEGDQFKVSLQTDPNDSVDSRVRLIAPQADAATRTRRVNFALQYPSANYRIGTTVTLPLSSSASALIEIPVSSVLDANGKTFVWVIDPNDSTVSKREIVIGHRSEKTATVSKGLQPGARILVAGVNSVSSGQKVKFDVGGQ